MKLKSQKSLDTVKNPFLKSLRDNFKWINGSIFSDKRSYGRRYKFSGWEASDEELERVQAFINESGFDAEIYRHSEFYVAVEHRISK
jgi:hypothetical protein